jgi:serine/threonine protein kinase
MKENADSLIGQQFGNYRLLRLLGQGGFADVYLGEHIHLNTNTAIKVLRMRLTNENIASFKAEAQTIARLDYPHIIRVLDFGVENNGTPFLVMVYAPNGSLRMHHLRGTQLPLSTIVPYVKQAASALQYAHNQRLIHRDIKPENMLLAKNNDVLLSDFGIALVTQSSRYSNSASQEVVGTAAYMAPEQLQGKPVAASDQYSLAIVAYEWLSGTPPFQGTFMELCAQHLTVAPPLLRDKVPMISPDVEQIIFRALAKDPQWRFNSVEDFAQALEQASSPTIRRSDMSTIHRETPLIPPPPPPGFSSYPPAPLNTPSSPAFTPANQVSNSAPTPALTTAGQISNPVLTPAKRSSRGKIQLSIIGLLLAIILILLVVLVPAILKNNNTGTGGVQSTATSAPTQSSQTTTPPITTTSTQAAQATTPLPTTPPQTSSGQTLYSANWSSGLGDWTGAAQWKWIQKGQIGSDGTSTDNFLLLSSYHPSTPNYAVEAQIQLVRYTSSYYGDFGILVRTDAGGNGYYASVDQTNGLIIALMDGSNQDNYGANLNQNSYTPDTKYHTYRIEVKTNTITLFLDGQQIGQATDNTYLDARQVGLRAYNAEINVTSFKVFAL